MVLPLYLAMTAQEMVSAESLPPHIAYMACHFSPSGQGLSNLPRTALPGQMLILDDQFPFQDHSASIIAGQLLKILNDGHFESLLLDFQRPDTPETAQLAKFLEDTLPCPVAVSHLYAANCRGPVFLPPAAPDVPLEDCLSPWKNREIWLEASMDSLCLTVTAQGCSAESLWEDSSEDPGLPCPGLHCHCRTEIREDRAVFLLRRTPEDFQALLEEADRLGIRRAIGLWQELC